MTAFVEVTRTPADDVGHTFVARRGGVVVGEVFQVAHAVWRGHLRAHPLWFMAGRSRTAAMALFRGKLRANAEKAP